MCPIVPTFTCGFVRSYFAFAIPHALPLAVAILIEMEPMSGIEPETSSLPRTRSTDCATWAHARALEREPGLEPAAPSVDGGRCTAELFPLNAAFSTVEPRVPLVVASLSAHPRCKPDSWYPVPWWGGEDLNPRRRTPADLQSAPFGHLGT